MNGTVPTHVALLLSCAAIGCNANSSSDSGPLPAADAAPHDMGVVVIDSGQVLDSGNVMDGGDVPDTGEVLDTGLVCQLTLADTPCPSVYPANDNTGCDIGAVRPTTCNNSSKALYLERGFASTTCCYDGADQLSGAIMRSDLIDECYQNEGIGPMARVGGPCCVAWEDSSCGDAGVTDTGATDSGVRD